MGRRGPRPKPSNLRVLEGMPGHRPLPPHEPKPPVVVAPAAPRTLNEIGRAEWKRQALALEQLHLLTTVDLTALEEYCATYAELRDLRAERRRRAATKTRDGLWRVDAAIDRKRGLLRQFFAEFGFTPAARTRIEGDEPPAAPKPQQPTGTEGRAKRADRFFRD